MAKRRIVSFEVNGDRVEVAIQPRQTLLDVLRDEIGLTGSKEGCSNGNCGACTVNVDGVTIDSCCALGVEMEGRTVRTVEGLANGAELHPVQKAFVENGGLQCGICTPGFLMSTVYLLEKNPHPSEHEIRLNMA
ncbi:MAG: (2Fe-2S)-binding protein, partial [Chloroflexi bacterium]|nr:(2Fe-2S)-binding protein [Chloroflexota bacterium]